MFVWAYLWVCIAQIYVCEFSCKYMCVTLAMYGIDSFICMHKIRVCDTMHICLCVRIFGCICIDVSVYVCMYVCMHAYICMYVHKNATLHTCNYGFEKALHIIYIYIYIYYICIHMYTYVHTHTHTASLPYRGAATRCYHFRWCKQRPYTSLLYTNTYKHTHIYTHIRPVYLIGVRQRVAITAGGANNVHIPRSYTSGCAYKVLRHRPATKHKDD